MHADPATDSAASFERISAVWLGVAAALTSATQLRLPGLPVGPGEILLVTWVIVTITARLMSGRIASAPVTRVFTGVWLLSYLLMLTGWLVAIVIGKRGVGAVHDFLAFLLAGLAVITLASDPRLRSTMRRAGSVAMATTALPLVMLLAIVPLTLTLGPLFLFPGRFQGWAANANQVALAMAAVPFLAFRQAARVPRRRGFFIIVAVASMLVGLASASDGLLVGWIGGLFLAAAAWAVRFWTRPRTSFGSAAVVAILLPMAIVGAMALSAPHAVRVVTEEAEEMYYGQNQQGAVRLALWRNGVKAMSLSPVVGLGPGRHSGLVRPHTGSEAHNSFVDWGTSTGVAGAALLIGLYLWVLIRALRSGSAALFSAVAVIIVVSIFGYYMRHPLFWFYLLWIAVEAEPGRTAQRQGMPALNPAT